MKRYTDKIYFALFFWLGFAWFSHSVRFAWPAMCSLVAFYFFHNVILRKGEKHISNSYMPFLLLGVFLIFRCFIANLEQLMSFTENTYHRAWSGFSTGARMFMDVSFLYCMFRYISHSRKNNAGLFFEGFANGSNLFTLFLFMKGSITYTGGLENDLATNVGFTIFGETTNSINGIAPLFLQFFFMNFLAYVYQKRRIFKVYHIILCIVDIAAMFLIQSKTCTLGFIMGIIAVLIVKKAKWVPVIIIGAALVVWAYVEDFGGLSDFLPPRYSYEVVSTSLSRGNTGRTEVWHDYLSNSMSGEMLLAGLGYGMHTASIYQKPLTMPLKIKSIMLNYNAVLYPHSTYISMFIDIGGIGFVIYILIILTILFRLIAGITRGTIHWIYLTMYITFILWSFSEGGLFSDMFLLSYAVVLPEVCNNVDKNHSMITLQNFCRIFLNRKMIIAGVTLAVMAVSLMHCVFSPTIYRSRCVISPTEYTKSLGRFPGAVIARILYGNTLAAKTAEKFDLVNVYGKDNMTETVNFMKQNIIHANDTLLGRMITFEILDTSPDRAAKISDFMIDCLNEHIHQIYSVANSELSALYTHAADTARTELLEAEDSLVQFQKDNRIILAQPQVRDLVRRITSMRNEISAKEREIYTLKSYASSENVRLKLAQSQLQALQSELADLEVINETQNVPAAMIGYTDRLRRVERLRSRMFEAMDQLYLLRNDPREFLPVVHIIDKAHELVEEFKPYKAAVMIIGLFTGLSLGILLSILDYKFRRA